MSIEPIVPPVPLPPAPDRFTRMEYLGFQEVDGRREFRLRVFGREGSTEFRFGIAIAAFSAGRVSLQDGPDVCYQKLLRVVAAGETAIPDVITIDDAELASYREVHTSVPKRRARPPLSQLSPPTPPSLPGNDRGRRPPGSSPRRRSRTCPRPASRRASASATRSSESA